MSSSAGLMSVPAVDLAAQTRQDFPLLAQKACLGQPLIYLDHAATSQSPVRCSRRCSTTTTTTTPTSIAAPTS